MASNDFQRDKITIAGQTIPIELGDMSQADLRFYPENPRIYTIVNAGEEEPTQAVIQNRLEKMDHVKKLISSIRSNGGLTDALIVRKGQMVVLEGNSRLAAYRVLARNHPSKWARVPCKLLPEDIDEALVFSLLGQYHIIGRKDWAPYEQAGYLYRRVKNHKVGVDQIARELGLSVKMVNQLIGVYSFMVENGEDQVDRWSYYDEYLGKHSTKRAREEYPQLDKLVIKKIRSGEIERATDVRDKLAKVCVAGGKVLTSFVAEKADLEEAYQRAISHGADDVHYKRMKKFHEQVCDPDMRRDLLEMSGALRKKCVYELGKIAKETAKLCKEFS